MPVIIGTRGFDFRSQGSYLGSPSMSGSRPAYGPKLGNLIPRLLFSELSSTTTGF